jgi:signal transduction histidine kinase/CheY-like chemotaxis protein
MKVLYTRILAKNILLAFLAFVIILTIAAIFVRNSISHKLEHISKLASNAERDETRPQKALLLLHQAEDDFQSSLLSTDTAKTESYKKRLSDAFNLIDTLLKENRDSAAFRNIENKRVQLWYTKKLKLSDQLYGLKHNFDSLLSVYASFKTVDADDEGAIKIKTHQTKKSFNNNVDTVKKAAIVKKRGFFSRIKHAIANKADTVGVEVIQINHNQTNNIIDSTVKRIASRDKDAYAKRLQQLQNRNKSLLNMQRELINLNSHITTELERIISDLKEINYNIADEFKSMAFKSYQETTALLNRLYLVALFLVLIFAGLLIVFIIKLSQSERLLRKENERSVTIAQQKMDLLLHMSHEIRNPLTAIKGFLYIFSQTELSKRQSDMLDSIRLSSDMLLGTLNDTLDAAKMENSEFKINNEPFNPDFTLKEVIESMEFSANKKKLSIDYSFKGDQEAILLGDSFRLKQVMVNLLSNAIKYTSAGSIHVKAELSVSGEENRLQIDVADTGAGIRADQQANLFSKYYQTNSAKGKTGTGLGLYICKQFVNLQNGKISVKSVAGEGSTFSFYIPYVKAVKHGEGGQEEWTEDPMSLLNGISILAVDDNELNLKFLKMMTSKWNVTFHQATNGQEALKIINEQAVTIVLTDIQMPEMDGHELMKAIRELKEPLNRLPVIVISGGTESSEIKTFLQKGFSGLVSKPFVEKELIEQIAKVIKD